MLCFRCEHRAKYLELLLKSKLDSETYAYGPRCECKSSTGSVSSCYMFEPCKPVVTVPAYTDDKRPRFAGAMLSSREQFERVLENVKLEVIYHEGNEVAVSWTSKD